MDEEDERKAEAAKKAKEEEEERKRLGKPEPIFDEAYGADKYDPQEDLLGLNKHLYSKVVKEDVWKRGKDDPDALEWEQWFE
jgi:hypothetical protein